VDNKKIVLISSGQPSLNPRLMKEADTLTGAGYEVAVLYAYWNDWGTRYDKELFAEKKWKAICIGGDPEEKKTTWLLSRLIHRTARYVLQKTNNYKNWADIAISRSGYFLTKAAKNYEADLYIAHNLGALSAAAKTAKHYNKPYGFDAEDFHRQEVNDDVNSFHHKMCTYLEDKYLPAASYLTASSPLIAARYSSLYDRAVTTLLNVFPKTPADVPVIRKESNPLKLFWFSQTIGANRGLEMIIAALSQTKPGIELHILGQPANGYQQNLIELAQKAGIDKSRINFYAPVKGEELFKIALKFDIGLASETGFCLNNNIALSNKIFTYIQSGLAVVASSTRAQSGLINRYPKTGKIYSNANELSDILNGYNENRELLYQTKLESFKTGQTELNWDIESSKFLRVIESVLADLTTK
jgi:glycosyltransferase involved in cell wall biosynthesis